MSKWDDWVEISTTRTALHNGDAPEFFQRAGDWIDELQAQLDNMVSSDNLFNEAYHEYHYRTGHETCKQCTKKYKNDEVA